MKEKAPSKLVAYPPDFIQAVINHIAGLPTGRLSFDEVRAMIDTLVEGKVVKEVSDDREV